MTCPTCQGSGWVLFPWGLGFQGHGIYADQRDLAALQARRMSQVSENAAAALGPPVSNLLSTEKARRIEADDRETARILVETGHLGETP